MDALPSSPPRTRFDAPWWPAAAAAAPLRTYGAGFDLPPGSPDLTGDVAAVIAAQLLLRAIDAGTLEEVRVAGLGARTSFARLLLRAAGTHPPHKPTILPPGGPGKVSPRLEEALAADADQVVAWSAKVLNPTQFTDATDAAISDLAAGGSDPRVATAAALLAGAAFH